ncbi:hypothetical protein [Pseudomonas baetica]|uniref:hypothetical protein n=1 Tax=Pseudomonas baetica TaxID=674054 RepID=UPI002405EE9D|nr:hypothetical protein [Pseudomonas baetica]MDF9778806.1 hypothetical protein [Pseudomonas baetica]
MRLRTTAESDTMAYATSPINFGGLEKEDLLIWLIPMAASNNLVDDSFLCFAIGCTTLWFYKKLTGKQPNGHLLLRASLFVGEALKSDFVVRLPALRIVLYRLNKMMSKLWIERGLLPSPTYCNLYEP